MIDAIVAHEGRAVRQGPGRPGRRAAGAGRAAAQVARRYPHELSGGMKQRAVMAISTVLNPKVIVADEPTSALDVVVQRQVMQTLGPHPGGHRLRGRAHRPRHGPHRAVRRPHRRDVRRAAGRVRSGRRHAHEPAPSVHPDAHREHPQADGEGAGWWASRGCRRRCSACRRAAPSARAARTSSTGAGGGARVSQDVGPSRGRRLSPVPGATPTCRRCRPASCSTRTRRSRSVASARWRAR